MKKVLLATTALIASAGIAAASDVSAGVHISGSAEIGVVGGDTIDTQFWSDLDVTMKLSGETDNGLSFGASIDLDELGSGISAISGPASVYISGGFGSITIGDTDGALDWAMKEAIIGGTINDVQEHAGYNGNGGLDGIYDGQVARYDNSFGDFGVAVSAEVDDSGAGGDAAVGLGVKYSFAMVNLGVGYQSDGIVDIVGVSVDATFGDVTAIVNYTDMDTGGTHTGFALGYTMDALTVAMNWGEFEAVGGAKTSGYGAIVNYGLSDDVTLQAGYGFSDFGATDSNVYSVGLSLSF